MNRVFRRLLVALLPLIVHTARADEAPLPQSGQQAPTQEAEQAPTQDPEQAPIRDAEQPQPAPQDGSPQSVPLAQTADHVVVAPQPAPAPKHFWQRLEYTGMIDFFGIANLADPTSNENKARIFDSEHGGGLHLNYTEVSLMLPAAPVGFRIDVGFGNSVDVLHEVDPASNPASGVNPNYSLWHRNIPQAYVSFQIPVLRGIRIDVGKFATPIGFEVLESRDNWNYSRGLLFAWAIPLFHTGLRVTMPLSDSLTLMASWVNGWNTFVLEGSSMRTGHVQLAWSPRPWVSLVAQYMGGYSGGQDVRMGGDKVRHLVELIAVFKPTNKLSLALDGDYGYDDGNQWGGVAAYARYQFLPWLASALRAEVFDDPDGFAVDGLLMENASEGAVPQTLWEATVTPIEIGVSLGKVHMLLRAEYRHDQSTVAYFDGKAPDGMPATAATPRKTQDTITGAFISYF